MEQFLTVSQISRELGLSTRMLRYYEKTDWSRVKEKRDMLTVSMTRKQLRVSGRLWS